MSQAATLDPPSTEERLGRTVEVCPEQKRLDTYCKYLESLADGTKGGRGMKGQELLDHRFGVAVAALGKNTLTGHSLYSIDDFRLWWRRAEEMGCSIACPGPTVIGRLFRAEVVPNALLRERVQAVLVGSNHSNADGGMTLDTIADGADLVEGTYVGRLLGINPYPTKAGIRPYMKWYLRYEQATAVARVIGVPYQEVGL